MGRCLRVLGVPTRATVVLGVLVGACVLAGCGGSGRPTRLDRGAVAVADRFTTLAWNKHDCRAAERYLSVGKMCAQMRVVGIPAWSHFPLTSLRIRRGGCNTRAVVATQDQSAESPGCIQYTASSGFFVHYGMTQTSKGWRIVGIGLAPGSPGSYAVRLDHEAVAVADAFTRQAWNKHDCLAGSRYLLNGLDSGACPTSPTGIFPITSHHIRPNSCGHGDWDGGYRISPGCIEYTASGDQTLQYAMTKTPQGWRIIETGTSGP